MPQPYFVPVKPSESRNTQSKGVAGSTSTVSCLPLTFRLITRRFYNITLRVVDSNFTKRRDLILHLVPVADDDDRRAIGIEVFGGGFLNVCRSQCFDLRAEIVDEVLVEIVGVDRGDASSETLLTREFDREVSG